MTSPTYAALYQVNIRVYLQQLSHQLGRPATLDDIPETALDEWATLGFDWIYCLGVWQTGLAALQVSRTHPDWVADYQRLLADLQEADICGSCFAVTAYTVHTQMGGDAAMERLRDRLHQRGLKLMLDFVPNHTAPDHPWVLTHPAFYIQGTIEQLQHQPHNYCLLSLPTGDRVFAYGRDPNFAGWPDTLQLNYSNPDLQLAQIQELLKIARLCDGVRCDMAMLLLPEVFQRTWGMEISPFWPRVSQLVRQQFPEFVLMAEVYWDLEWELQQQGFDYTYDKRLYDRLLTESAHEVRQHFWASLSYQQRSARFLENHDEARAASAFPPGKHQAAAIISFFCPGLRFFHQGQLQGYCHRISIHLQRGPIEPTDATIAAFYHTLLGVLRLPVVRSGHWQLLDCLSAWEGNWTNDCFLAFAWQGGAEERLLVVVNYADHPSQCYVKAPFSGMVGQSFLLQDCMSETCYDRSAETLLAGLYLDLPAWGYHVFQVLPLV